MSEVLPIPYLDPELDGLYRGFDAVTRQRIVSAARAVVEGEMGYKHAHKKYDTAEVDILVRAIVSGVRRDKHPPPWEATSLESTTAQKLLPSANLQPILERAAEDGVVGTDMLMEWVADGTLSAQQATAVVLLVLGEPAVQVAKKLGIEKMTLYGWRRLPEFIEAHNRLVQERADALIARADEAQSLALKTLIDGLSATTVDKLGNEVPDWPARLKAADSLLDRGGRLIKPAAAMKIQAMTTPNGSAVQVQMGVNDQRFTAADFDAALALLEGEQ